MVNKGETQQESRGGDGRREGTRGKTEKNRKGSRKVSGERASGKQGKRGADRKEERELEIRDGGIKEG